ncbi:MAG: hypothetical protein JRN56_02820 [Nitrososphaerota archaeon]|jgi:hypothetical protein|nr:hypothetical protein [Nitrososphaerota archaeon]MDG6912560.1 hypothetical protein [Nitrososphaerota archaeon]MDG6937623.1 hypothetical protein [Nitrososphaerota archaeon]MDG6962052.1 hypothetical protein [Nitrososphaerota archaeon]MDG6970610.1 hypothetical protein [Nitrososphaerota archaeon]
MSAQIGLKLVVKTVMITLLIVPIGDLFLRATIPQLSVLPEPLSPIFLSIFLIGDAVLLTAYAYKG